MYPRQDRLVTLSLNGIDLAGHRDDPGFGPVAARPDMRIKKIGHGRGAVMRRAEMARGNCIDVGSRIGASVANICKAFVQVDK